MKGIRLNSISFTYRGAERPALDRIDFAAEPGQRIAVIGLTGAGKSSLLKCMNRLIPVSYRGDFEGSLTINGEEQKNKRPAELARKIGIVFQDFESQLFSTTAALDVAFGPENFGLETDEIRRRVGEALEAVGLEGMAGREPSTLSGGQKQRLAIATVLALDPETLCLDEPVTDLDPAGRKSVSALVARLCSSQKTVILAEHEMDLIKNAERIVALDKGRKVFDRDAKEVLWDEDALTEMGVRPPDMVGVFKGLGLSARPDTVEDAAKILREKYPVVESLKSNNEAPGKTGPEIIRAEELCHTYPNGHKALDRVDISISSGEFTAILGRNGSGKTTLVKHLNGLLLPTEGVVSTDGEDTGKAGAGKLGQKVGFVFQDPDHQIFASRVFEEVAFAPRNFGFSENDVKDRVEKAMDLVGLSDLWDRDPFMLTKGERQRVALASVLAAEPPIIILDEPTTGLDYSAQKAVMELLAELNRAGRTVIVITHTLWVAAEYASRAVLMAGGKVIADGPTRDVFSDGEGLESAGLEMPEVTALGSAVGVPALSVDELVAALRKNGET